MAVLHHTLRLLQSILYSSVISPYLCDSKVISTALLEIVKDVNLNKNFNHKSNTPIKKMWLATWNERNLILMSIFMLSSQCIDSSMVLINSNEERNFRPALHQPAIGKISYCGFCDNLFRNFNVILKREEVENLFRLFHMEKDIKLCIWLIKCWKFRRIGMEYCWHMASAKNIT